MLVRIAVLMKPWPEKVAYIKHISGMEKGTPLREEISSSGSKNDEEERIGGSETWSTCEQSLFFFRFSESRACTGAGERRLQSRSWPSACLAFCSTDYRQGHPTGNFKKKAQKQQQSMNKAF